MRKNLSHCIGETFPEYERFCDTPLMANMIDSRTVDVLQRRLRKGRTGGFVLSIGTWGIATTFILLPSTPKMRNHKIGQHILDWVGEHLHRPVFLEAEIPYDAITARRLCFYKRNGFLELAENPGNPRGSPPWRASPVVHGNPGRGKPRKPPDPSKGEGVLRHRGINSGRGAGTWIPGDTSRIPGPR